MISVVGIGHIEVEADILEIRVNIYKTTATLKQSQEEVNNIVDKVLNIFKENNVRQENIHTTSFSFAPNYIWEKGKQVYRR